jgi:hypothetical protein
MTRRRSGRGLVLALVIALAPLGSAGCSLLLPPTEVALRTTAPGDGCDDALLPRVRLVFDRGTGAAFEPVDRPGERIPAVFPFGYRLRVAPRLELLDETGKVVATGDDVLDVGGSAAGGPWHACSIEVVQRGEGATGGG